MFEPLIIHEAKPRTAARLLRRAAIRRLEAAGLAMTPSGTLMRRAGAAVAQACRATLETMPVPAPVLALIGPGNNGGDALWAALDLAKQGYQVAAISLEPDTPGSVDRTEAQQAWQAQHGPMAAPDAFSTLLQSRPLVIDGLFGLGLTRPLSERAARWAAALPHYACWVVAVDVPSGLDADTGAIQGMHAVRADCTVTFLADKPGLHTGAGCTYAGQVMVADLELPEGLCAVSAHERGEWIDGSACQRLLPARAPDCHKGQFGDALILMGAAHMQGAGLLAALGAQAVGAGRVHLGELTCSPPWMVYPEFLQRTLVQTAPDCSVELGHATAIVIGCGLGDHPHAAPLVAASLAHPAPVVLDADALNLLSATPAWHALVQARAEQARQTVLTPHPLEAARLLGLPSAAAVQTDRIGYACVLARHFKAHVVLKGAGTVWADPDGRWAINGSGHPALAVAGTGDVLAGALTGLLAQGLPPAHAVRLAVWLHGAAAEDLVAHAGLQAGIGLRASELAMALRTQINQCVSGRLESRDGVRNAPPAWRHA